MTLYHATPLWRVSSILEYGLLTRCCRDGSGRIWLHEAEAQKWALQHCAKRHGCDVEEMALLLVTVPESMVIRAGNHRFVVCQDIEASWVTMSRITDLRRFVPSK